MFLLVAYVKFTLQHGHLLIMPQLQCLLVKISDSDCLPTDVDCVCQSQELTRDIADCMLAHCTMQESLGTCPPLFCLLVDPTLTLPPQDTARVQSDLCNLSDDSQTTQVVLYTTIIYSIAFIFVVLRLVGKTLSKGMSWDDLAVMGSLAIVSIPLGLVLDSKYTHVRPFISRCSLCASGGQRLR
jgi:hypothetical protein